MKRIRIYLCIVPNGKPLLILSWKIIRIPYLFEYSNQIEIPTQDRWYYFEGDHMHSNIPWSLIMNHDIDLYNNNDNLSPSNSIHPLKKLFICWNKHAIEPCIPQNTYILSLTGEPIERFCGNYLIATTVRWIALLIRGIMEITLILFRSKFEAWNSTEFLPIVGLWAKMTQEQHGLLNSSSKESISQFDKMFFFRYIPFLENVQLARGRSLYYHFYWVVQPLRIVEVFSELLHIVHHMLRGQEIWPLEAQVASVVQ